MRLIIVLGLAFVLSTVVTVGYLSYLDYVENAAGASPRKLTIQTQELTPSDEARVKTAVMELLAGCSHLERYLDDIVSISAFIIDGGEYDYRTADYGWRNYVAVYLQISNDPKHIPPHYRAAGNIIRYYLGAGRRPGILTQKLQGQLLCGTMALHEDRDGFLKWPPLQAIDRVN